MNLKCTACGSVFGPELRSFWGREHELFQVGAGYGPTPVCIVMREHNGAFYVCRGEVVATSGSVTHAMDGEEI